MSVTMLRALVSLLFLSLTGTSGYSLSSGVRVSQAQPKSSNTFMSSSSLSSGIQPSITTVDSVP